jgi:hypothetical protein
MSTSRKSQPRQPRGVPTGGQWRAANRPEGKASLTVDHNRRPRWLLPLPASTHLWRGWGEECTGRPRRLTEDERERTRAWRQVAKGYRHGDCGREQHRSWPYCDIACLACHARIPPELALETKRAPWEVSDGWGRDQDQRNAAVRLMVALVMHAVPK